MSPKNTLTRTGQFDLAVINGQVVTVPKKNGEKVEVPSAEEAEQELSRWALHREEGGNCCQKCGSKESPIRQSGKPDICASCGS